MSDISVMGLGLMGSALARALIAGGHKVTVWNRSPAKTQPLIDRGADSARSVGEAVEASPVILVCLDNYQTTRTLFQSAEVVGKLPGRIAIELSTGTPKEAREANAWFTAQGARYLDGVILCSTTAVGTLKALLLYSGDREVFERCRPLLASLGEDTRFVGENVATASTLDLAWLSRICAEYAGVYHGVAICQSEGIDLDLYSAVFTQSDSAHFWLEPVKKNDFANATASVSVWRAAIRQISRHANDAGISSEVPDLVAGILGRAEAAGYGKERVAAMVKVLRNAP